EEDQPRPMLADGIKRVIAAMAGRDLEALAFENLLQTERNVRVVFDDQNSCFQFQPSQCVSGLSRVERQPDGEAASAALARPVEDVASVSARDLPGQRQPKAGALDPAAQRILRPVKLLKDPLLTPVRHAESTIQNLDFHGRRRARSLLNAKLDFL